MPKHKTILHCKRGLGTISAIFLMFLMVAGLTILIATFNSMNANSQSVINIQLQRAKELISLRENIVGDEIKSVTIVNEGSIQVKIGALYKIEEVEDEVRSTIFLGDPNEPSQIFEAPDGTYIDPKHSIIIIFKENQEPKAEDAIIASTVLGTKSFEYTKNTLDVPIPTFEPTDLVIGPLLLKFEDFKYQPVPASGTIDPLAWKDGWVIPKGTKNCAWKIVVTNIDDRDITLSRYSSFIPVPTDATNIRTWFIEPSDSVSVTKTLKAHEESEIIFIWNEPKKFPGTGSNTATSYYTFDGVCTVFLTFHGSLHEIDGVTVTPYGQTIPFQGTIMAK